VRLAVRVLVAALVTDLDGGHRFLLER
jgi:hypothetical protein